MTNRITILIDIFIVTYNRADDLKKTLHALSNLPEWCRVTVMDNASTDKTAEVVASFKARHLRNRFNKGYGGNYLTAIENAEAPYVWVLGDDDAYDFRVLDEVKELILDQSPEVILMGGKTEMGFTRGAIQPLKPLLEDHGSLWLASCFVAGCAFKVEMFDKIVMAPVYCSARLLYPPTHCLFLFGEIPAARIGVPSCPLVARQAPAEYAFANFRTFVNWMELLASFGLGSSLIRAQMALFQDAGFLLQLRNIASRIVQTKLDWRKPVFWDWWRGLVFSVAAIRVNFLVCLPLVIIPSPCLSFLRQIFNWIRFSVLRQAVPDGFKKPKAQDILRGL